MMRMETQRQTAACLLLIEKDEAVFNQISSLVDSSYLIRWYQRMDDAIAWMRDRQTAALIIVNENQSNVDSLAALRATTLLHSVPILLLCNDTTDSALQLALRTGVTDLLSLSDPGHLEKRIQFFLTLMRRVSAQPDVQVKGDNFRFVLPTWKRAIDITASLQALIVFSPLMLLTALLIKLDSKGPIFYTSKRVGANYKVFGMIKFRTMRTEADQLLKQMALENNMYSSGQTQPVTTADESLCENCRN